MDDLVDRSPAPDADTRRVQRTEVAAWAGNGRVHHMKL
ncbi:hypothetical protein EBBID32_4400 [Sphingobium indicum BiD32]|uniref:Uncharacterized protein n=1 Tax=Sphingobium indicum BiD32 TaxID=1301087 RepID=N1MH54_9SPHN|nr:hypothetical protein EBBID32_4400 [Sphingobium indicum BiD32]